MSWEPLRSARREGTQIPRWVVLLEGSSDAPLTRAAAALAAELAALGATDFDQACYRFEHRRGKLASGEW